MNSERIGWIDVVKGIGIFLVVLGHIWTGPNETYLGRRYIYSFHMPLFFFISGFVFKIKSSTGFIIFFKKKFKSLIYPYMIFSIISFIYFFIFENTLLRKIGYKKILINIFLSQGADDYLFCNPVLWFLTCLFIVNIIFYFILNYRNCILKIIIVFVLGYIGFILSKNFKSVFFWNIDVSFTAITFFGAGYITNYYNKKFNIKLNYKIIIILNFLFLGALFVFVPQNGMFSMAYNILGENIILTYIMAYMGIFIFITTSIFLNNIKFLRLIGENTLNIMGAHYIIIKDINKIFSKLLDIPQNILRENFLTSSIESVIIIIIILFINYIFKFIKNLIKDITHPNCSDVVK